LKEAFSEGMSSNDEFFLHAKHCSIDKRMIHFAAQSVLKWQFCGLLKFAQKVRLN
jgi:hypothetical protein